MTREELRTQEGYYEMGFITGVELYIAYTEYLSTNNEDEKVSELMIKANKMLHPLVKKIKKEISNL